MENRSDKEIQESAALDKKNAEWVRAEAVRLDAERALWIKREKRNARRRSG